MNNVWSHKEHKSKLVKAGLCSSCAKRPVRRHTNKNRPPPVMCEHCTTRKRNTQRMYRDIQRLKPLRTAMDVYLAHGAASMRILAERIRRQEPSLHSQYAAAAALRDAADVLELYEKESVLFKRERKTKCP